MSCALGDAQVGHSVKGIARCDVSGTQHRFGRQCGREAVLHTRRLSMVEHFQKGA